MAELRLAQFAALVLALMAGVVARAGRRPRPRARTCRSKWRSAGCFFLVAAIAPFRDPREALTMLALGFAAHAVTDVMHRPGLLPTDLAPQWYFVGCACLDAVVGALCYLPLLKR